jgi:hypothetical protein
MKRDRAATNTGHVLEEMVDLQPDFLYNTNIHQYKPEYADRRRHRSEYMDLPRTKRGNLRARLAEFTSGCAYPWEVDRYIHMDSDPRIEAGDLVLLWQSYLNELTPVGIHAIARVLRAPYRWLDPWMEPGSSADAARKAARHISSARLKRRGWRTDLRVIKILDQPVTKQHLLSAIDLSIRDMQILHIPNGRVVFWITPSQWEKLKGMYLSLVTGGAEVFPY